MNHAHIFSTSTQANITPMNGKKYRNIFSKNYTTSIAIMIARTLLPISILALSIFLCFESLWNDGQNISSIDSEGYILLELLSWSRLSRHFLLELFHIFVINCFSI